jgi:CRISPR-associated protein Cst2
MTRQEGDAVPYGKDEYCAIMKGMFSLDFDQIGTFSMLARTGFMNINEIMKVNALKDGAQEHEDPIMKDSKGKPIKFMRIQATDRLKRVQETILALKTLAGGAKLTTNLADVTPKLIVLATLNSGNHPFSHLAIEERGKAVLSVAALAQVVKDYQELIDGNIYIGRRTGFLDELEPELQELVQTNSRVKYGSINEAIDNYVKSIKME